VLQPVGALAELVGFKSISRGSFGTEALAQELALRIPEEDA
jgi:hypothetical protein